MKRGVQSPSSEQGGQGGFDAFKRNGKILLVKSVSKA